MEVEHRFIPSQGQGKHCLGKKDDIIPNWEDGLANGQRFYDIDKSWERERLSTFAIKAVSFYWRVSGLGGLDETKALCNY